MINGEHGTQIHKHSTQQPRENGKMTVTFWNEGK